MNHIENIRKKAPIIHQITNFVTVNDCANITLAIGANPIMADAIEEAADIAKISDAVVLNVGAMDNVVLPSMFFAAKAANEKGIPVILDPVGAGTSPYRNQIARRIISEIKLTAIRGNISEMKFLAGLEDERAGLGIEDKEDINYVTQLAKALAESLNTTIIISGETDVISDGKAVEYVSGGHKTMTRVKGSGCMVTALLGSFIAANEDDKFGSIVSCMKTMKKAGEYAHRLEGEKTSSFRDAMIDHIATMSDSVLKIEENQIKYKLYFVTDQVDNLEKAIKAGVTCVQLRAKNLSSNEFYEQALYVRQLTKKYGITMIVNDRVDIALAVDACGIHIGTKTDMPVEVIRNLIPDKILGVSVSNVEIAKYAFENGADYLSVGSLYPTKTKEDAIVIDHSKVQVIKEIVNIPIVGVGGISLNNIDQVVKLPLDGFVVSKAILEAEDIDFTCKQLLSKIDKI